MSPVAQRSPGSLVLPQCPAEDRWTLFLPFPPAAAREGEQGDEHRETRVQHKLGQCPWPAPLWMGAEEVQL